MRTIVIRKPHNVTTGAKNVVSAPRRGPIRTCVACRTSGGKRGLLRVVRLATENDAAEVPVLALDLGGKKSGRGAYVCPTTVCIETALKRKALERSLKMPVPDALAAQLREQVADTRGDEDRPPESSR